MQGRPEAVYRSTYARVVCGRRGEALCGVADISGGGRGGCWLEATKPKSQSRNYAGGFLTVVERRGEQYGVDELCPSQVRLYNEATPVRCRPPADFKA